MPATAGPQPPADAPRPAVAAFDFDGTLTHGGSVWPFLVAVCGWRTVIAAAVPALPLLALSGIFGGSYADRAKEALLRRTIAGRPAAAVAERAEAFGTAHFHRRARPEVVARVRAHQAAGHRVALVSASPALYLRPVAEALGADALIATGLAVGDDGRLTGGYDGGNCRGAAKLDRVRRWAAGVAGGAPPGAAGGPLLWAYGNSAGDRELLAGADVAVNVGRLGRLGRLRRFVPLHHAPAPDGAAGHRVGTDGAPAPEPRPPAGAAGSR